MVGNNVDLTEYKLYINYKNANGGYDAYPIDDVVVSGDNITFSWLLSRYVTLSSGVVNYSLCAKKLNGDIISNEWNTTIANGTVIQGLEATQEIIEEHPDMIERLLSQAHTHTNKDILDKLSISNNKLQYNGSDVGFKGDKGDPGAPGTDGITPHIGDNGNWYLGTTDTGKPSKGEQGPGSEVFYIDLAGDYPTYTCPVAMTDIKAAYEAGKVLECRCTIKEYTAMLPLFVPMPSENAWIFSGAGALTAMGFWAQSLTIAIFNGVVQASNTRLASEDDIPAALPNPNALTIKIGSTTVTYDGSIAKTVEIADGTEVGY